MHQYEIRLTPRASLKVEALNTVEAMDQAVRLLVNRYGLSVSAAKAAVLQARVVAHGKVGHP